MSGAPHEPYHPDERKALVAAARAQRETGLSLTVHPNSGLAPGCDPSEHLETYVEVVEKEGGDLSRGYSHLYENILPWLQSLGASRSEIHQIMVENPQRLHGVDAPTRG